MPFDTVQLISLVAALQQKTGTKKDLKALRQRYKAIEKVCVYHVSITAYQFLKSSTGITVI